MWSAEEMFCRFYGDCAFDWRDLLSLKKKAVPLGWRVAVSRMTAPVSSAASRAAVCPGDPDTFALEMIKLINDKEFRWRRLG